MKEEKKEKHKGEAAPGFRARIINSFRIFRLSNSFIWLVFVGLFLTVLILSSNVRIIQAQNLNRALQSESVELFADSFDRPDNESLDNGWSEVELTGAQIGIQNNRMCFLDTSDLSNRPVAYVSFQQVISGELLWRFDFDWTRRFHEGTYRVLMQMGDGALMSDDDQNAGVGVNLVWGQVGGDHETLAYRKDDIEIPITGISGQAMLSVLINLDSKTYDVSIGSAVIQRDIPFDNLVNLDRIRFLTDGLNEIYFSGRCIDDLTIESLIVSTATPTLIEYPTETPTPTNSETSTSTPSPTPTSNNIPTYTSTPTVTQVSTVPLYGLADITLIGPESSGMGTTNPFRIAVNVMFTGPLGQEMVVPAFYDGDGVGGMDGNVWKVRFSPDAVGVWTFTSTSEEPLLNGQSGVIEVFNRPDCPESDPGDLPDFSCMGRLQYADTHYLRFSNGDYWIKGGIDDPENFLGTAYGDWDAKKSVIDYLHIKDVNSIYIVTNTIRGDSNDTWPWVGASIQEAMANSDRYDIAKLLLWEDVFTYIESRGIVLHLVLNDDSAWNGYDHDLYFRTMIARFGYHPSIIWNIGEEANEIYTDSEQIDLASQIKALDPYRHPVTVHRMTPWPFLGNPNFDITSLQPQDGGQDFSIVDLQNFNLVVIQHRQGSELASRAIPIMIDEVPRVTIVNDEMRKKFRAEVLYPIFFAGGNYELHFYDTSVQGGTLTIYDLEPMLEDMHRARSFVEALPFWEMQPINELLVTGEGYVFTKAGEVYSVYLPSGGQIDLDLSSTDAYFDGMWFNPRDGIYQPIGYVLGGSVHSFTAPSLEDWVLLLNVSQVTPTPTETATFTPTPIETYTPTISPSATLSPTLTATKISTPKPSATSTPTPTNSPTSTLEPELLFTDNFDRADGDVVGNGWVEIESLDAQVGIQGNRLCVLETADEYNRPLLRNEFQKIVDGQLFWEFDFDWTRIGDERRYWLYMQLGEGVKMSDDAQDEGVGVNLVWTREGITHEVLSYRQGGETEGLIHLNNSGKVKVEVDVGTQTYTVFLDGVLVQAGIPFDNNVNLDTVRIFTNALKAENFSGRCFDNLTISRWAGIGMIQENESLPAILNIFDYLRTFLLTLLGFQPLTVN